MSETRAVLIRLAAQHDINATRFGLFLDAVEHNLDPSDAANIQEALRSVLAPGYQPAFVTAADPEPESDAGPSLVFALVHVLTEEERGARAEPTSAWDLNGIFEVREAAIALCKSDADAVITFELDRDYAEEHAFEILRPTVSPDPVTVDLSSLFPKEEPKPAETPPPGGDSTTSDTAGNDSVAGGQGADSLTAAEANDSIDSGSGNDTVTDQKAPDATTKPAK